MFEFLEIQRGKVYAAVHRDVPVMVVMCHGNTPAVPSAALSWSLSRRHSAEGSCTSVPPAKRCPNGTGHVKSAKAQHMPLQDHPTKPLEKRNKS